jgi:comEA protein
LGLALCLFLSVTAYYYLQTKAGASVEVFFSWGEDGEEGLEDLSSPEEAVAEAGVKLDINRIGTLELQQLPGIGPALAARILEYREENGPFTQVEDLLRVNGIGEKTLERIRPYICVE